MSKRKIFDYSNTNFGNSSLDSALVNADGNSAFGTNSLTNVLSSDFNTGFGFQTLMNNITGNNNTAIGANSLLSSTGSNNTAIGYNSGGSITIGDGNVIIGSSAGSIQTTLNNTLILANSGTSNLIYGDFAQQKIGFCYGNGSITGALSGDISIDGQANKVLTVERNTTTTGKNLTISAGGSLSGGTNLNGGDLLLRSGVSTGTGSSKIVLSLSDLSLSSSTTTDNSYTDRLIIAPPRLLSITKSSGVITNLFIVNVPSGKTANGSFDIGVSINTSSDFQSSNDYYMYSITNKAGTLTSNFSNLGATTIQTSGLFSLTMSLLNGTNQVTVRASINPGAISGTLAPSYAYMVIRNNSCSSISLFS